METVGKWFRIRFKREVNFKKEHYQKLLTTCTATQCVKSVRNRSLSGMYFPAFGLNTERYSGSLRIQSKCGKIRNKKLRIRTLFSSAAYRILIRFLQLWNSECCRYFYILNIYRRFLHWNPCFTNFDLLNLMYLRASGRKLSIASVNFGCKKFMFYIPIFCFRYSKMKIGTTKFLALTKKKLR